MRGSGCECNSLRFYRKTVAPSERGLTGEITRLRRGNERRHSQKRTLNRPSGAKWWRLLRAAGFRTDGSRTLLRRAALEHLRILLPDVKLHRTEAIILHTVPARERDKLVIFLTPEEGKKRGWAYGARSLRTRFGASLEPLAKVRLGYVEKEGDDAVRIESVDLIRSLFPAQQKLIASIAASYIAETVDTFAQAGDPSELVYRLLDRTTEALLSDANPLAVVAYAELWMLRLGGILPSVRNCMECHEPLMRPLRFDLRANGFVCPNCAGRDSQVVANEVADALDRIVRAPVTDFATEGVSLETLFELRTLVAQVRRAFLGHELKSFDVLAGVLGSANSALRP